MSWSSFFFVLIIAALAVAFIELDHEVWALLLIPAAAWFAFLTFALDEAEEWRYVLTLGGVRWTEADFCRGWEIDGRTGSGKTASGVVPIIHALKISRPDMGILALDTKGDLSEPLMAIAEELGQEPDNRLCSGQPGRSDEGFDQLLPGPTVTVEEMQDFFSKARQAHETAIEGHSPLL
jgi:hypothetical protein